MMTRVLSLAAVGASLILAAAAPPAAPIAPKGKWVVNFDDAQCLAERDYGTADKQLRLVLKQPPLGSVMQVAVISSGGHVEPQQYPGSIAFDEQPPLNVTALRFRPKGKDYGVHLVNVPGPTFAAASDAKAMRLRAGELDTTLALADVGALARVMNECVADLRRVWNVDDTDESDRPRQGTKAKGVRGLIRSSDYPVAALDDNQSGTTRMALLIDEQGRVADCSIVETSGVAILDSQSCAVVRERARFEPARDERGKPRKSAFVQQITWRTEQRAPFL